MLPFRGGVNLALFQQKGTGVFVHTVDITPTLGPELFVNGDFSAWTLDDPDGWVAYNQSPGVREISEVGHGEGYGGTGTGMCNVYTSTGGPVGVYQNILTTQSFYQVSLLVDTVIAGAVYIWDNSTKIWSPNLSAPATYTVTRRAENARIYISRVGVTDVTIDDASCKLISNTTDLFTHPYFYGSFTVNLSRNDYFQGGVIACYEDANNYLHLYLDGWGQATLLKVVGGVTTVLGTYGITYAADSDLTLKVYEDGTLDVIYDGTTKAAGIADTGLRGTQGGGWLTNADNVTINLYTWDVRDF